MSHTEAWAFFREAGDLIQDMLEMCLIPNAEIEMNALLGLSHQQSAMLIM